MSDRIREYEVRQILRLARAISRQSTTNDDLQCIQACLRDRLMQVDRLDDMTQLRGRETRRREALKRKEERKARGAAR